MPAKKPARENMPLYFFIALLTLISACGLLGSDDKEPLEPGPRNYEWTVDTLSSPPGGFIYDIWGSSPDDVWAVAGGGLNNLWHFDGNKWSVWDERVGPSFYSIYGFAQNNVWMGGNDGQLYHFDGSEWSLSFQYQKENITNISLRNIWGTSSSNVFATGVGLEEGELPYKSFILRFNSTDWNEILFTDFGVQFQRIRVVKTEKYIQAIKPYYSGSPPDTLLFYQYKNSQIDEIYSSIGKATSAISLNRAGSNMYYVIGDTINKYDKNEFEPWQTISHPYFGYQIYGRHEKDLFLRMSNGLAHYNGENIEYLFDLDRSLLTVANNAMLFEEEVFFIVRDYEQGTNYIYHGTLTDKE